MNNYMTDNDTTDAQMRLAQSFQLLSKSTVAIQLIF